MYLDNSDVRLVTVKEDGSVEILYQNQVSMYIPKERVFVENQQIMVAYTSIHGKNLFDEGKCFWAWEKERSYCRNIAFTVSKEDVEDDGHDIYIKNISSVKFGE